MEYSLKKIILIVVASTAGFLVLFFVGFLMYFNMQFSLYKDVQNKFSIRYPKDWKVVQHPRENVAVVFLRPKDTVMDSLQENFNITIQPVQDSTPTLQSFTAVLKNQMIAVFGKSITIVEDKPFEWGEHEGHKMSLLAPTPDHLRMINAWVLYNNQAYILTFLGDMNKYQKDVFIVNEMIRSFRLQ